MTSSFKSVETITFTSIIHITLLAFPLLLAEGRDLDVFSDRGSHHCPQDGAPEARS